MCNFPTRKMPSLQPDKGSPYRRCRSLALVLSSNLAPEEHRVTPRGLDRHSELPAMSDPQLRCLVCQLGSAGA